MAKNCLDVNVPIVDNSLSTCSECGYIETDCVTMSDAIAYISSLEGESLTSALNKLVAILVTRSASITALQALSPTYLTLTGTQTATNKTLTTPSISLPTITGLTVYANNAAALSGGLVAGQVYKTATGTLMIVY